MDRDGRPATVASLLGRRYRPRGLAVLAVLAIVVLAASLVPVPDGGLAGGDPGGSPIPFGLDPFLVSHLIAYGALAVSCRRTLTAASVGWSRLCVVGAAVVLATGYGAVIEVLQVPLPWRSGGLADAGINAVGAGVGVVLDSVGWVLRRAVRQ
ncbi:VanZ family protein [Halopenitus sp. POP-27]|uniref:VanZ family protein n=1 Tax=Halopenitus sp. POP-27 TaxID=2994425 RepID=UPI0024693C75|nr:VanZ family protein [Halopenitus sp. POP-27]